MDDEVAMHALQRSIAILAMHAGFEGISFRLTLCLLTMS